MVFMLVLQHLVLTLKLELFNLLRISRILLVYVIRHACSHTPPSTPLVNEIHLVSTAAPVGHARARGMPQTAEDR